MQDFEQTTNLPINRTLFLRQTNYIGPKFWNLASLDCAATP